MNIYSTKVYPYVYKLTHRTTGEFYFGSRYTKTMSVCPEEDIQQYQSSSKQVKKLGFDNFDVDIIALFYTNSASSDAHLLENTLIHEHWGNPLLLNGHYYLNGNDTFIKSHGKPGFAAAKTPGGVTLGMVDVRDPRWQTGEIVGTQRNTTRSEATKNKLRKPKSDETKAKISAAIKGRAQSSVTVANRVTKNTGQKRTDEQRARISEGMKGKQQLKGKGWWTDGVINTRSAEQPFPGWYRGRTR